MKVNSVARALVSVSDKRGIAEFCRGLEELKIEILSTGGTARILKENGIMVTEVSEYTGFSEIMDGRVKTLHPKVYGGILGRRDVDEQVMRAQGILPIDLVVVNLYPFVETVAAPDCKHEQAIENIDIGGPAMIRAAAKNYQDVAVVIDPNDYVEVLTQLREKNHVAAEFRVNLQAKAFRYTALYDTAIANYLSEMGTQAADFPDQLYVQLCKKQSLRYGENPHQQAAFYAEQGGGANVSRAKQLSGKELSFNNIADLDAALECVKQFAQDHACVIIKHANPCGAAVAKKQTDAYQRAYNTDPKSAFGGIIAFNCPLEGETAVAILQQQFVEAIIAPMVSAEAREVVAAKENVRLLEYGEWKTTEMDSTRLDYKKVNGGLLVQHADVLLHHSFKVVTECTPDDAQLEDLLFSWKVAKFVKSNAIVYAAQQATIGIGAGQMSRVDAVHIAMIKAQHAGFAVGDSVMASDAFFPFRDGVDTAAQAGVRAVIQPGGSMRDDEVIAAANEHNIAMVFTGMRHFRH